MLSPLPGWRATHSSHSSPRTTRPAALAQVAPRNASQLPPHARAVPSPHQCCAGHEERHNVAQENHFVPWHRHRRRALPEHHLEQSIAGVHLQASRDAGGRGGLSAAPQAGAACAAATTGSACLCGIAPAPLLPDQSTTHPAAAKRSAHAEADASTRSSIAEQIEPLCRTVSMRALISSKQKARPSQGDRSRCTSAYADTASDRMAWVRPHTLRGRGAGRGTGSRLGGQAWGCWRGVLLEAFGKPGSAFGLQALPLSALSTAHSRSLNVHQVFGVLDLGLAIYDAQRHPGQAVEGEERGKPERGHLPTGAGSRRQVAV